jgi:hypothetical protein
VIDDQPIGVALNRNLGSPVAPGEAVEAELDRLIQRRSRQKDPDEESELWRESVRAYEEKRRQMARAEWHLHHTAQAERLRRTLEALIEDHEAAAAQLREAEASNAWSSRYAKTGSGIVSRLSTSTALRYEVCRCRAIRTD